MAFDFLETSLKENKLAISCKSSRFVEDGNRKTTSFDVLSIIIFFAFYKYTILNLFFQSAYDSSSMKENNDTEVFDLSKATLIEGRNYFENEKLIYQISSVNEEAKGENL